MRDYNYSRDNATTFVLTKDQYGYYLGTTLYQSNATSLYAQHAADSTMYYGTYVPAFLKQTSQCSQPLVVVHQSDQTFVEGKVYHAQAIYKADLLLTEVVYRLRDGQNYSVVEVYNPMLSPADLSDYALVRLTPTADGSHLAYRKMDGTTTEDLGQAQLLPLSTVDGASTISSGKFSAWSNKTYTSGSGRYKHLAKLPNGTGAPSNGVYKGQTWNYGDLKAPLYSRQTLLVGASGYINTPLQTSDSFISPISALASTLYMRAFFAYADGEDKQSSFGNGVMDYNAGDAFALVKSNGKGGWQIIDATGPIGMKGVAFAGAHQDFKTEFEKMKGQSEFSLGRVGGVNLPFIYPFRTVRKAPSLWCDDWTLTAGSKNSLGFRDGAEWARSYMSIPEWEKLLNEMSISTSSANPKRTPLDANYPYYWQHIPQITRDAQN